MTQGGSRLQKQTGIENENTGIKECQSVQYSGFTIFQKIIVSLFRLIDLHLLFTWKDHHEVTLFQPNRPSFFTECDILSETAGVSLCSLGTYWLPLFPPPLPLLPPPPQP